MSDKYIDAVNRVRQYCDCAVLIDCTVIKDLMIMIDELCKLINCLDVDAGDKVDDMFK